MPAPVVKSAPRPSTRQTTRPSAAQSLAPSRSAASRLDEIKSSIADDRYVYAFTRRQLLELGESVSGRPEAATAEALLSKIDASNDKRATEALEAARAKARSAKSEKEFDSAAAGVKGVRKDFADGPWLEAKGKAAIDEALAEIASQKTAWQQKNIAAILEKARTELRAGRTEEAEKMLAGWNKWPKPVREQAAEVTRKIESKEAELAAAAKRERARTDVIKEFDRLMIAGEFAAARAHLEAKAGSVGNDDPVLRAGKELAQQLVDEPAARLRGVKSVAGQERRLKLKTGRVTGIVKAATDDMLTFATTFTINNQTREKTVRLSWSALHEDQRVEFAGIGGLTFSAEAKAARAAYAALTADDADAAIKLLEPLEDDPLSAHVLEVAKSRSRTVAYENAMAGARKAADDGKWKEATDLFRKALEAIPDDSAAAAAVKYCEAAVSIEIDFDENFEEFNTGERENKRPVGWKHIDGHPGYTGTSEAKEQGVETPYGSRCARILTNGVMGTESALEAPLQAGMTYVVRFNTAAPARHKGTGSYKVQLLAGETVLAAKEGSVETHDMSHEDTFSFTAPEDSPNIGQRLSIRVSRGSSGEGISNSITFDNLRLDAKFTGRLPSRDDLASGRAAPPKALVAVASATKTKKGKGSKPKQKSPPKEVPPAAEKKDNEEGNTRTSPPKPAAPPETGRNILANGGFEEIRSGTRFPTGWTKNRWGTGKGVWSVKSDRTNPRTGDFAIVVSAFEKDLLPGAYAVLSVDKGTYVVSYWACADVGKKCHLSGHFAGSDLDTFEVGEDYKQFTAVVNVEKKPPPAQLKIWCITDGVRVWIDDVEVKPVVTK
jgi:hypothetical protein